jgi:hypothetical protein
MIAPACPAAARDLHGAQRMPQHFFAENRPINRLWVAPANLA